MNAQAILSEPEPCPVCFNDDVSSLKRLNGCGHSICGDCKSEIYITWNQFEYSTQILKKENTKIIMKLMKCPICRTIEKPTCGLVRENAKVQIGIGLGLIKVCNLKNPDQPATNLNSLMRCQSFGCTRRNRTRRRCPNHPEISCCAGHWRCDQCINP
jgi:hypothetical protein